MEEGETVKNFMLSGLLRDLKKFFGVFNNPALLMLI